MLQLKDLKQWWKGTPTGWGRSVDCGQWGEEREVGNGS